MRSRFLLVCAGLVAAAGLAQARTDTSDIVDHPFSADFASGGKLRLHVRSGDVHVVGTDQNSISVELSGKKAREARDVRVRLKESRGAADLRIFGGPRNDITLTIRIPRNTDLYARIPFGDVEIEDVVGDKDVALHAGDLTIAVGNPADYGHVDASVTSGDLSGAPFGEEHGGLFRSFEKEGTGKYRLHAHVGAGDLTLR